MHIVSLLKKCIWVIPKDKKQQTNPTIKEMGVIEQHGFVPQTGRCDKQ